jgi:hypothetical protein
LSFAYLLLLESLAGMMLGGGYFATLEADPTQVCSVTIFSIVIVPELTKFDS